MLSLNLVFAQTDTDNDGFTDDVDNSPQDWNPFQEDVDSDGIGDWSDPSTIRVSLSANPVEEVKAGFQILKSLGIRNKGVTIISCPSCARQNFDVINTVKIIEEKLSHIKEAISLSIIGCVVNGPGEAKQTNIGVTGGGKNFHQIYIDGNISHRMEQKDFIKHVVDLVEDYAEKVRV